jgi:hypothetical protein
MEFRELASVLCWQATLYPHPQPEGKGTMDRTQEVFADGIGEIVLSGGMVRMDLVALTGSQRDENNQPRLEFRQRVVMPPDGFLRSFSAMEDLVKQLIKAGLVKPREGEGGDQPAAAAREDQPKSPNF